MIVSSASAEPRTVVGVLALLGRERRVEQQAGHADDAVHRRADLVAHRREELALGLRRGERRVARLGELAACFSSSAR